MENASVPTHTKAEPDASSNSVENTSYTLHVASEYSADESEYLSSVSSHKGKGKDHVSSPSHPSNENEPPPKHEHALNGESRSSRHMQSYPTLPDKTLLKRKSSVKENMTPDMDVHIQEHSHTDSHEEECPSEEEHVDSLSSSDSEEEEEDEKKHAKEERKAVKQSEKDQKKQDRETRKAQREAERAEKKEERMFVKQEKKHQKVIEKLEKRHAKRDGKEEEEEQPPHMQRSRSGTVERRQRPMVHTAPRKGDTAFAFIEVDQAPPDDAQTKTKIKTAKENRKTAAGKTPKKEGKTWIDVEAKAEQRELRKHQKVWRNEAKDWQKSVLKQLPKHLRRRPDESLYQQQKRLSESFSLNTPLKRVLGTSWRYYDTEGDKEVLILLHGGGTSPAAYFTHILNLSSVFRVLAPWFPEELSTFDDYVAGLRLVMRFENVKRVHIYGMGFGGMVAQYFLYLYPDRVRSCILSHTSPPQEEFEERFHKATKSLESLPPYVRRYFMGWKCHARDMKREVPSITDDGVALWTKILKRVSASKVGVLNRMEAMASYCGSVSFTRKDFKVYKGSILLIYSEGDVMGNRSFDAMQQLHPNAYTHRLMASGQLAALLHGSTQTEIIFKWLAHVGKPDSQ